MAYRIEKTNSLIRQEISELLRFEVKDPRLSSFITVNEVSASPDLKQAKVYVSDIGGKEEREETLSALTAASGFFRTKLAKRLKMRYVPELIFQWDDSIERGDRLLQIIDRVSQENE